MKISQKLTIGFTSIALLVALVGYFSINTSQQALHERIGRASSALANEIMNNIDKSIYSRVETFQEYSKAFQVRQVLAESNREFDKFGDVQAYIQEQDRLWTSVPKEELTPFMHNVINNKLSEELREKLAFYDDYPYKVFGEVFVTNKFGANVAQTGKTTDYYQADETWWQEARKNSLYVDDVEYDESAGVYSTSICVRIDGKLDDFLGIAVVVLNIEETATILESAIEENALTKFKLLNKDWQIIYATDEHEFLEPLSKELLGCFLENEAQGRKPYFIASGQETGNRDKLFSYARSKGHRDYEGSGWILATEQDAREIFASVNALRAHILSASLAITALALFIGLVISRSISRPLDKLTVAVAQIGQGRLDAQVAVESNDEIGFLAGSFNSMVRNLREITTSKEALDREITIRSQTEEELRLAQDTLEQQLAELELMQDAALNMMEDIDNENSERKNAEMSLKREKDRADAMADEALKASTIKSEFLANMSHEIRTPMNAIIGFSDVLAEEELDADQKSHVKIIQSSGKNLLAIIDDILDISKIEAGQFEVEAIDWELDELLDSLESLMGLKAREKGIEFKVVKGEQLPTMVHTDPTRLRQCLINLTGNAIKFTQQGHVHVNAFMQGDPGRACICFEIEDTGIGVSPEKQETIFEPFAQADGSTSRKYGGTGLGLAITKQLAHLLGGELVLTSEEGQGSVFSLMIPVGVCAVNQVSTDRRDSNEHLHSVENNADGHEFSGHVLVAEDVETNQTLIRLLLERIGMEVTVAADGNEAVQKALAREFDLILMDIQMPGMNGYQATAMLRAEGLKTPIIALTANAMKGDDKKCIDAGCDDYLPKPISQDELVRILNKHVSRENAAV